MNRADRFVVGVAVVAVVGVAVAAGWLSYAHMVELAHRHGEAGARGAVFPLTVDGVEVVASLVLFTQRRAGRSGGWQPWLAIAVGSVASLVANAEVGPSDWWGRCVAAWPALALVIAVKLLSGLLEEVHRAPARSAGRAVRKSVPQSGEGRGPVPPVVPRLDLVGSDEAGSVPAGRRRGPRDRVVRTDPDRGELEAAARKVRDRLVESGAPVNRVNLAAGLRSDGHAVRNARVGELLRMLGGGDRVA